jgi:hypothetical protein
MGDANSTEISTNIHWTDKLEEYFASTGEKAHCLGWVHKQSEAMYSTRKTFIDLPVIVGSGVIAFLNAGSQSMFEDARISSIALGIGSLVVGILNTMGTYFGWAKRAEGHRISAIHYSKLYRFISVEMALPRDERMSPHDLLKYVKDQYDRLAEISPLVPSAVIQTFQKRFKKYTDISRPEEANGLEKISIYKPTAADEAERTPGTVRVKMGPAPEAPAVPAPGNFTAINPMIAAAKKAVIKENFVPSVESMNDIADSIKLPIIPKETMREAVAASPQVRVPTPS